MSDKEKLSVYLNKSKLLSNVDYEKKIRIAILGSFTLNGLEETIRVKKNWKEGLNISIVSKEIIDWFLY